MLLVFPVTFNLKVWKINGLLQTGNTFLKDLGTTVSGIETHEFRFAYLQRKIYGMFMRL